VVETNGHGNGHGAADERVAVGAEHAEHAELPSGDGSEEDPSSS
jgi:hypothetical protein